MPERHHQYNRESTLVSATGTEHDYTSNNVNQYTDIDSEQLYYDDTVNLTIDDRGYSYGYDFENRLIEVKNFEDTLLVEYEYDALGRRTIKREYQTDGSTVDKTVRYYHNDRWHQTSSGLD